ncbi:sensor histidine kinase [Rhodobacteraceae bacterium F11138]|nr:sensor histidine kinase [Rhodobacteraceae bacterium F11138]
MSRLTVRLIIVLSLAILPLGLVSTYQSWQMLKESSALSKASLLDRTYRAAERERAMVEHSLGVAVGLAETVSAIDTDNPDCDATFARLAEASRYISFAAYLDQSGGIQCASNGARNPDADSEAFRELAARTEWSFFTGPNVANEGQTMFSITVPVTAPDARGLVWVAIPFEDANRLLAGPDDNVDLVLFDPDGNILATEDFSENRRDVLPGDQVLASLPAAGGYAFRGHNHLGEERDFAVAPILGAQLYVLGSWPPLPGRTALFSWRTIGLYFPAMIWVICVLVAAIGLHRLVIRHINRLRYWMRLYTDQRAGFENAQLEDAPEELEAVAQTFRDMTERIAIQENQREEDLQEKTVLLREVHHRVKNNLQVISSIMNMQVRNARSEEAKHLIRRLQDRVMALASIHRRLYMSQKLSMIQADELLADIVGNLVVIGSGDEQAAIKVSTHFDPVPIAPEQSMPLSLILTEAATNAVKYCGAAEGETCWIDIALSDLGQGRVCLSVVNSVVPAAEADEQPHQAGLGLGLIETFVTQLEGTLEHRQNDDIYALHVTFTLSGPPDDNDEDEAELVPV